MTIRLLLNEVKQKLPMIDRQNEAISKAPVGWHIQHSLMVINVIISSLEKSEEKNYKWRPNFLRTVIMTAGKFPRGKAQSPKSVRPKEKFSLDKLQADFIATETNLEKLDSLPKSSFFTHPIFGDMKLKPAIRFLKLHTNHHLKIIEDIIK